VIRKRVDLRKKIKERGRRSTRVETKVREARSTYSREGSRTHQSKDIPSLKERGGLRENGLCVLGGGGGELAFVIYREGRGGGS